MDYANAGNDQDGSDARKLLIVRDRLCQFTFCHRVRCEGIAGDRIVKLLQLQEQIIAQREHKTISQNPPAHDPQANGEAERAVQEVKAQLRAIESQASI